MKGSLIFIVGLLFGAAGSYFGLQIQRATMSADDAIVEFAKAETVEVDFEDAPDEESPFLVRYGEGFRLEFLEGGEAFTVQLDAIEKKRFEYYWKSLSDFSRNGQGILFEKYKKSPSGRVTDDGGSRFIEFPGKKLEWSLGAGDHGYIYFDPKEVRIQRARGGPSGEQREGLRSFDSGG